MIYTHNIFTLFILKEEVVREIKSSWDLLIIVIFSLVVGILV